MSGRLRTPGIQRARRADLPALRALDRACFPRPLPFYIWLWGWLPGGEVRVLWNATQPVAYAVRLGSDVVRLGVHPAHRRQGYARRLLRSWLAQGRRLRVQVREGNAPARALYAELGFQPVGDCRYAAGETGLVLAVG